MTLEQINENPEFMIMITVCSLFFALGVVSMSPWLKKQYSQILILQRKYSTLKKKYKGKKEELKQLKEVHKISQK
jgi:hypothetical protein|tara:strand:+ start:597 stop:821 length:225 start_codon:yes stop_codon:yes gene_type:complete